jgi:hypothetical protein
MTNLDVSDHFHETLQLLLSCPTALTDLLVLQCGNQADFDEIQSELAHLPAKVQFTVQLEFDTYARLPFQLHDAQLFRGHLSGLTWGTESFSTSQASQLLQNNPTVRSISVTSPRDLEMSLVCTLRSLQKLSLMYATAETDSHLAEISHACSGLEHLWLYGATSSGLLDRGLVALAETCTKLLAIEILDFSMSDAAMTALCAHCPQLLDINLPTGRLTSEALMALLESGARWRDVTIGWNVRSASVVASNARIFCHLRLLRLMSPDPACNATLALALASLPSLVSFIVEFSRFAGTGAPYFPAQNLLTLAQNSPNLTDLCISHPVSGATEECLVQLFSACPRLRRFNSGGSGLQFTDSVLQAIAAHCPCVTSLNVHAAPTLTDAGVIAIAQRCPALRYLSIFNAGGLTDAALGALARHSRCLKTLELTNSPRVTEIAQLYILHRCTTLTALYAPKSPMSLEAAAELEAILQSRRRSSNSLQCYCCPVPLI